MSFVLGKDYLDAIDFNSIPRQVDKRIIPGGIGEKLGALSRLLHQAESADNRADIIRSPNRPLYFLPDWDDFLDVNFDFSNDSFSNPIRANRVERHPIAMLRPGRICDGVLISLAQNAGTKGLLKRFGATDLESLAPIPIRKRYELRPDQWAFGDCGAFSYVNEVSPTISTRQAAALYQMYGFDFGASVDHIPIPEIERNGRMVRLSRFERQARVNITRRNAEDFISLHKENRYSFRPMGIIQAISAKEYGTQLQEYSEMGYRNVALGGLVPKSDSEIAEVLDAVGKARENLPPTIRDQIWVHLFGIYRPKLQAKIQESGIASFDSATYFRKAWLRAGQNYWGSDGKWYSAIRVPITSDPRTKARLHRRASKSVLRRLERKALTALQEYASRTRGLTATLNAIMAYDKMLIRGEDSKHLREAYKRTLKARIWEQCHCKFCGDAGINVLIFRGYNRNKRRGAHNTFHLYKELLSRKHNAIPG